jgi:D-alanyl-D-alanine carboxypeptidase
MGSKSTDQRFEAAAKMFDYGFGVRGAGINGWLKQVVQAIR